VQAMHNLSVDGSLQFNAQFECGNLRKAIQVIDVFAADAISSASSSSSNDLVLMLC